MKDIIPQVEKFCADWKSSQSIQIILKDPTGYVYDIAEFHLDGKWGWGEDRVEGVLDFIECSLPNDEVELKALQMTGERRGGDDEWETLGSLKIS